MTDTALRPTLFGAISSFVGRVFESEPPMLVQGFDPDRQTLTLTVDNAQDGDEVIFRDSGRGCDVVMGGKTLARIVGVRPDELDAGSIRLIAG
ncbi:hypothetical protein [Histidinibacterium aquaticum]|uniref:Uncharacterized protein n=1 Tax=Histidinibacterium aquaticum TaxID=2613962 RepID=A0A5J5GR33_9RHOB|nr:hypothetical protein [Histidinibacterium aquaticum]KAA9010527.1 hypothetical protein F3S47_04590 [Histidinibacterium aquaticum]